MGDRIEEEVITAVVEGRGVPRERVRASARLLQDLGMDGDDAADFFLKLERRFGTDLSGLNTRWNRHFRPEPTLLDPIKWLFGRWQRVRDLEPITVGQVIDAVRRGAWDAA